MISAPGYFQMFRPKTQELTYIFNSISRNQTIFYCLQCCHPATLPCKPQVIYCLNSGSCLLTQLFPHPLSSPSFYPNSTARTILLKCKTSRVFHLKPVAPQAPHFLQNKSQSLLWFTKPYMACKAPHPPSMYLTLSNTTLNLAHSASAPLASLVCLRPGVLYLKTFALFPLT